MRVAIALFLILIFWLLILTMAGCGLIVKDVPLVNFENPRADYVWGLRPDVHSFVVCILLIIVAWLIIKVYDYFKGKK